MKIIVDSREQLPYQFEKYAVETTVKTLQTGDYSLCGYENEICIERKSIDDLISCLMDGNRKRFERELSRGQQLKRFYVVCEGLIYDLRFGIYRSRINPQSAIQSVITFMVRYGVNFIFCLDRHEGEFVTYSVLQKYWREHTG